MENTQVSIENASSQNKKITKIDEFVWKIREERNKAEKVLKKTKNVMKRKTDKRRGKTIEYKKKDLVWINNLNISSDCLTKKLAFKRTGLFPVIKKVEPLAYKLWNPKMWKNLHPVINKFRLRLYCKLIFTWPHWQLLHLTKRVLYKKLKEFWILKDQRMGYIKEPDFSLLLFPKQHFLLLNSILKVIYFSCFKLYLKLSWSLPSAFYYYQINLYFILNAFTQVFDYLNIVPLNYNKLKDI